MEIIQYNKLVLYFRDLQVNLVLLDQLDLPVLL